MMVSYYSRYAFGSGLVAVDKFLVDSNLIYVTFPADEITRQVGSDVS